MPRAGWVKPESDALRGRCAAARAPRARRRGCGPSPARCWVLHDPGESDEPVLQADYDWDAIKSHVRDLYFINSPNDPYGCDDRQGRAMFDRLGGTQIVRHGGHFGDHNQPYPTFELLDKLID